MTSVDCQRLLRHPYDMRRFGTYLALQAKDANSYETIPTRRSRGSIIIFIDDYEAVRAWLLSNPVLEDPLDLLIYCHCLNKVSREPTPGLRGHNYLVPGAVINWAKQGIGETNCVEVHLIRRQADRSPELIPGRPMKQVNRKREMTLTLHL